MLLKSPLKGKRRRLGDKYDIDDIKDLTGISSATINNEIDVGLIFPKLTEGARQKVGTSSSVLFFLQKCMNPFQARFGHCDSLFNGYFSDILCGQAYCIRPRGVLFE